eukprot:4287305-Amphidinium_carterae.3
MPKATWPTSQSNGQARYTSKAKVAPLFAHTDTAQQEGHTLYFDEKQIEHLGKARSGRASRSAYLSLISRPRLQRGLPLATQVDGLVPSVTIHITLKPNPVCAG